MPLGFVLAVPGRRPRGRGPRSPWALPQWFRSAVAKEDAMPADLSSLLFCSVDPLYELHGGFLRELEQRLALW